MDTPPRQLLVVEDDDAVRTLLRHFLSRRGYGVTAVESAEAALSAIAARRPDVVLLDIFMPKVSGLDLLRQLRGQTETAHLPVILVSALSDTANVVQGLQAGANDYVTKPISFPILHARIEAILRGAALVKKLEVQTEVLARIAAFDELTGIFNRRSLFHALELEVNRSTRYQRPLSLLMVDLDHFKRVNDEHGHGVGDAVLRQFAQRTQAMLRATDVLGRYGGEEFCVILPETAGPGASTVAERILADTARTPFASAGIEVRMTASVGAVTWMPGDDPRFDLLALADQALLDAKRAGRNRITVAADRPRA